MEFRVANELQLHGNVAGNWRIWTQKLNFYLVGPGKDKKSDARKIVILLNLIGDEGLGVYYCTPFKFENEGNNE